MPSADSDFVRAATAGLSRRGFLAATGAAVCLPAVGCTVPSADFLVRLLVPAYIYPAAGAWNAFINAHDPAEGVEVTLIANPSNGTFTAADPNYTAAINAAVARGVRVIGYIYTQYGQRPLADVIEDATNWRAIYPQAAGFFVDEQTSTAADLEYYRELFAALRQLQPNAFIVSNPGTTCDTGYLGTWLQKQADVVVIWEDNDQTAPFTGFTFPEEFAPFGAERIAAIVYNCTPLKYILGPSGARAKYVGYIFITNRTGENPYDGVPSYWTTGEVPAIQTTNVGF